MLTFCRLCATCSPDSIIRAAGRCNRERQNESAYLYVFDFADGNIELTSLRHLVII